MNPVFNNIFDFIVDIPSSSGIALEIWDKDSLYMDKLIGITEIDLEDRFMSNKFMSYNPHVPVEQFDLFNPHTEKSHGKINLWTELYQDFNDKKFDISDKPDELFELRIVIWDTEDIRSMDIEDTTDCYIKVNVSDNKFKSTWKYTDTHWRCTNGCASFNWRLKFYDYKLNKFRLDNNTITVQAWDKDILKSNDFISDASFNFSSEAKYA